MEALVLSTQKNSPAEAHRICPRRPMLWSSVVAPLERQEPQWLPAPRWTHRIHGCHGSKVHVVPLAKGGTAWVMLGASLTILTYSDFEGKMFFRVQMTYWRGWQGNPSRIRDPLCAGSECCPAWTAPAHSWHVQSLADQPLCSLFFLPRNLRNVINTFLELPESRASSSSSIEDLAFSRDALALATHRCRHWAERLLPLATKNSWSARS